jgi:hypothetical protein
MRAAVAPQLNALLDGTLPSVTAAFTHAITNDGKFHTDDVDSMWRALEETFQRQLGGDAPPVMTQAIEMFKAAMLSDMIKNNQLITPIPSQNETP